MEYRAPDWSRGIGGGERINAEAVFKCTVRPNRFDHHDAGPLSVLCNSRWNGYLAESVADPEARTGRDPHCLGISRR